MDFKALFIDLLATELDRFTLENDTYTYMDNLDNWDDIFAEQAKQIATIKADLEAGKTADYVNYLFGYIENECEPDVQRQVDHLLSMLQLIELSAAAA